MRNLVHAIGNNSRDFEASGRVLRLKQYLGINVRPPVMDAILTALEKNTLVEALYIQNFEEVRRACHASSVYVHRGILPEQLQVNQGIPWSGPAFHCLCRGSVRSNWEAVYATVRIRCCAMCSWGEKQGFQGCVAKVCCRDDRCGTLRRL